jgi:hypothetical protein
MPHTNDVDRLPPLPAMEACLVRTRTAVLNVLVGVAFLIAVSGWLIRRRAELAIVRPEQGLRDRLLVFLLVIAICSYLVRRTWVRRPAAHLDAQRREALFFWSHFGSALVAGLGVALGIAYGWWVDPRLEGMIPFWVVPMALGFLALPRRIEIDDPSPSPPSPKAPST